MPSSGMLRRVTLVRTDVRREDIVSIIGVQVPSSLILVALMMYAICYSETLVYTIATRRNILEDSILHSHTRESLKSYITIN
jgi:hypothetical protein